MNKEITVYAVIFIVLVLLQVLIFNHIAVFNIAVPFVFILFIIRLPIALRLNWLYTFSFLLGLFVDIFSDTPGVNSLSCTLLAALKRPVFYAYVTRDDKTQDITPTITTLGWSTFSKYVLTMTAIFCLINFSIEYFSFASVKDIAIITGASTILSFLLIMAADSLIATQRERL
ncbi:MAG: rod shape-determining protein MreD [Muribaculum sp.]|nr:rod shape-determining protein MreD [Muribaculum sp.]